MSAIVRIILLAIPALRRRSQSREPSGHLELAPIDYEDPGWSAETLFRALVPIWGARRLRAESNGLRALRSVYSALVIAPFVLFAVLAALGPSPGGQDIPPSSVAVGVAILGVASLVTERYWAQKPLPTKSAAELLKRYRALFLLRFANAESPILTGFVGFFLAGGQVWIYAIGLAFGIIGLLQMAPTRRDIQRQQAELVSAGSALSLGRLLTLPISESRALIEKEDRDDDG